MSSSFWNKLFGYIPSKQLIFRGARSTPYFLVGYFYVLLQTSPHFTTLFSSIGPKTDLAFLFCLFTYTQRTFTVTLIYVATIGMFIDQSSNGPFGFYTTSFVVASSILPMGSHFFHKMETSIFMLFTLICTAMKVFMEAWMISFFFGLPHGFQFLFGTGILEIIINTLSAVPFYFISRYKITVLAPLRRIFSLRNSKVRG